MSDKCMYEIESYDKQHEWHCHFYLLSGTHNSWSNPGARSLCDEHADLFMKNNIQAGHAVWARRAKK